MKRILAFAAAAFAAIAAFAAFDVTKAPNVIDVLPPQAMTAGETNSVFLSVRSLKGVSAVVVSASAADDRTIDVTLYTTNAAAGGWSVYAAETFAVSNAFTRMLSFPADGLTRDIRIDVASIGANSTASAFILSY